MRDRGVISHQEAVLIAQRIVETCDENCFPEDAPGCSRCPFCSSSAETNCWLDGYKDSLRGLACAEDMVEEDAKSLQLELELSTGYPIERRFKEYKAVIDRVAKDGVGIPLDEYGRMERICSSFLDMVQDLNKSVALGFQIAGMIAKKKESSNG